MRRASSVNFITLSEGISNKPSSTRSGKRLDQETTAMEGLKISARQELNKPVGMVAVHIDEMNICGLCKALTDLGTLEAGIPIYLRVHVGAQRKCTTIRRVHASDLKIRFDEIKNFMITVSPKRSCADNLVRIEVVRWTEGDSDEDHVIVDGELHVYELIKKIHHVKNLKMYLSGDLLAVVLLKFAFSYGAFGYGYSNQLEDSSKSVKDRVKYSMFCRENPPANRVDRCHNIMLARQIGHPNYIHFMHKVNIGVTADLYPSEMLDTDSQLERKPVLVAAKIRNKINAQYMEYTEQTSRLARLRYLRHVVRDESSSPSPPGPSQKSADHLATGLVEEIMKWRKRFLQQSSSGEANGVSVMTIFRRLYALLVGWRAPWFRRDADAEPSATSRAADDRNLSTAGSSAASRRRNVTGTSVSTL